MVDSASDIAGEIGLVTQVVHGSFVDGHGIRTTVFLKGCPLRCVWCCNPEGQKAVPELRYVFSRCNGCGECIPACPDGAISLALRDGEGQVDVGLAAIDRSLCDNCGRCIDVCPTGALDWFGTHYSVEGLFAEVAKDESYYAASGGGVTIGGGEPTLQAAFLRRFLKRCRDSYIHTALDTCLFTTTVEGVKALEETDLLLCDIKGVDREQHFRNTGLPNDVILENLKRMDFMGKQLIVRVPLIPGYNDSPKNLAAVIDLLCSLRSLERVHLLPAHEYGKMKYEELGAEYRLATEPISKERQEEIKAHFQKHGLKTQIGG